MGDFYKLQISNQFAIGLLESVPHRHSCLCMAFAMDHTPGAAHRSLPHNHKNYFFSAAVIPTSVPSLEDPAVIMSVRFLSTLSPVSIPPSPDLTEAVSSNP